MGQHQYQASQSHLTHSKLRTNKHNLQTPQRSIRQLVSVLLSNSQPRLLNF